MQHDCLLYVDTIEYYAFWEHCVRVCVINNTYILLITGIFYAEI